jgi:hypothetical protein
MPGPCHDRAADGDQASWAVRSPPDSACPRCSSRGRRPHRRLWVRLVYVDTDELPGDQAPRPHRLICRLVPGHAAFRRYSHRASIRPLASAKLPACRLCFSSRSVDAGDQDASILVVCVRFLLVIGVLLPGPPSRRGQGFTSDITFRQLAFGTQGAWRAGRRRRIPPPVSLPFPLSFLILRRGGILGDVSAGGRRSRAAWFKLSCFFREHVAGARRAEDRADQCESAGPFCGTLSLSRRGNRHDTLSIARNLAGSSLPATSRSTPSYSRE